MWVQARFPLVARGDASPLHEVTKHCEGKGRPDLAHLVEQFHRVKRRPGDRLAAFVSSEPEEKSVKTMMKSLERDPVSQICDP